MKEIRFAVSGKVQGVFFRKSYIFILFKRGLIGGATNSSISRDLVHCSAIGDPESINILKTDLIKIEKLNTFGAKVESITDQDHGIELVDHQAYISQDQTASLPFGVKVFL